MTGQIPDEKPCLVQTPQGFSISYQNKLLYSKYNPSRAICSEIENLTILPGTLFLCCSPVLSYGLKELVAKLDDKSFCLLCEFDRELDSFSRSQEEFSEISRMQKSARLTLSELKELPSILHLPSYRTADGVELLPCGSIKRIVRLDFSAGVNFHKELYDQLAQACTSSIMTFWANRMTLVKFGRRYSQDFFKNLKLLPFTRPVESFFNSVTKPILVFGAGESTDQGILEIKEHRDDFFILCADTALQPLLLNGIEADGVFIEEAQTVIKKAFIGVQNHKTHLFAGLSAVPALNRIFPENRISFFTTLYTRADFIENLQKEGILPPANEPFGSVGLTAVYYALRFRKSDEIPVYIYGLDFSYSAGKTHTRGSMAHTNRIINNTRLNPIANYQAAFSPFSEKAESKDGQIFFTNRALKNYAYLFTGYFSGVKNLFDAGKCGIKLGLIQKKPELNKKAPVEQAEKNISFSQRDKDRINDFFKGEKNTLIELRDILSGEKKLSPEEQEKKIREIALPREYLYLHFPDGIHFSCEKSLLKRIRAEIDFFLKIFN